MRKKMCGEMHMGNNVKQNKADSARAEPPPGCFSLKLQDVDTDLFGNET